MLCQSVIKKDPQIYLDELSLLLLFVCCSLFRHSLASVSVHVAACVVGAGEHSYVNDFVHFSHLYLEVVDPVIWFSVLYLCSLCCPTATSPEQDCWNFPALLSKSSDQSHVTLIPNPVIRGPLRWASMFSYTLDWMIPIYPQTALPHYSLQRQELPGSSVCLSPDLLEASVSLVTEPADPWP